MMILQNQCWEKVPKNLNKREDVLLKTIDTNLNYTAQSGKLEQYDAKIKELEGKIKLKEREIDNKYLEMMNEQDKCKLFTFIIT